LVKVGQKYRALFVKRPKHVALLPVTENRHNSDLCDR